MAANTGKLLPDGAIPTMITPFLDDGKKSIDWNGVDCEYSDSESEALDRGSL